MTEIRVEGLERISEARCSTCCRSTSATSSARSDREALRALNDTGFFRDVELRREEPGVLVVVQERPTIRAFDLKGNKKIKTEDLSKSLRNVGLASGKILNRYTLEDVRQYLIEQYFSRGRYDVRVDVSVEEQPGNLVDIHVDIDEGKGARIRQINLVGNERFTDKQLLAAMELQAHNLLSFYRATTAIRASHSRAISRRSALLHGSRLRGLRDHLHAGGAGAREERPVRHGQRVRGQDLEDGRREARRPLRRARGNPARNTSSSSRGTSIRRSSSRPANRRRATG